MHLPVRPIRRLMAHHHQTSTTKIGALAEFLPKIVANRNRPSVGSVVQLNICTSQVERRIVDGHRRLLSSNANGKCPAQFPSAAKSASLSRIAAAFMFSSR